LFLYGVASHETHAILTLYLGRRTNGGGRRIPMFPIRMWNVHDRVLHDQVSNNVGSCFASLIFW